MSRLLWDQVGEKLYETGSKKGVLYPQAAGGVYPQGVPWNGLTSVSETPDGGDANDIYADDQKYLTLRGVENFGGTIEAYHYPPEFAECDGTAQLIAGVSIGQQPRKTFGFSFVSTIGNDVEMDGYGYKIHLIYGASASPSDKSYETINDSPDPNNFSWEFTTVPVAVTGHNPTAIVTIDSTKVSPAQLKAIEDVLYGTDAQEAKAAEYAVTTDTAPQSGKEYYTKSGNTYTKFTGSSFVEGTTYYEMTSPAQEAKAATTARLPLPDEVAQIMRNAA